MADSLACAVCGGPVDWPSKAEAERRRYAKRQGIPYEPCCSHVCRRQRLSRWAQGRTEHLAALARRRRKAERPASQVTGPGYDLAAVRLAERIEALALGVRPLSPREGEPTCAAWLRAYPEMASLAAEAADDYMLLWAAERACKAWKQAALMEA